MPIGPDAASFMMRSTCGVLLLPLDCLGRHVDLATGDPVAWDDPFPVGGLSGVLGQCDIQDSTFDPKLRDDEPVRENRCGEYVVEGGVKWFEGDWTFSNTDRQEADLVMGVSDVQVDALTRLPVASAPVVLGSQGCACGSSTSCAPSFAALFFGVAYDIDGATLTPVLDPETDQVTRWYQLHPKLRALGKSRAKWQNAADVGDITASIRSMAGPRLVAQIVANPPAWLPTGEIVDLRTGATFDDLAASNPWEERPFIDFFSSAPLPDYLSGCGGTGWVNPAAVV